MQYIRWIAFGVVAVGIIVVLVLFGLNRKLRQQLEALLLEKLVKTKVRNLEDQALVIKTQAGRNQIDAATAESEAAKLEAKIKAEKDQLKSKLETKGLAADDISNRLNNLRI